MILERGERLVKIILKGTEDEEGVVTAPNSRVVIIRSSSGLPPDVPPRVHHASSASGPHDQFTTAPADDLRLIPPACRREARPGDTLVGASQGTPMIVARDAHGDLNRLYLPVRVMDASFLAIVDCGTPRTWLRLADEGSAWVDDAHVAVLAGQRMVIPGRRVPAFDEAPGLPPVVGCVGNDFLLAAVTVLDVETASMTRLPSLDPTFVAWPALPFQVEAGMIFVDACLDGTTRRCQLDTGAPASLLLRDAGDTTDDVGEGRDVLGNVLPVRKGRGTFTLHGVTRDVPIWKMRSFPHLEEVGRICDQPIEGMLGLSSLGQKRIVLDPFGKRLLLEP